MSPAFLTLAGLAPRLTAGVPESPLGAAAHIYAIISFFAVCSADSFTSGFPLAESPAFLLSSSPLSLTFSSLVSSPLSFPLSSPLSFPPSSLSSPSLWLFRISYFLSQMHLSWSLHTQGFPFYALVLNIHYKLPHFCNFYEDAPFVYNCHIQHLVGLSLFPVVQGCSEQTHLFLFG